MTTSSPASPSRPSLATRLLAATSDLHLFLDDRGEAHALLRGEAQTRSFPLRSKPFRLWLADRGLEVTGQAPGSGALSTAIHLLTARAHKHSGPRVVLWNRVARGTDGAIWLDLGDESGRAVRVTAEGYRLVASPPPLFRRYGHQEPLPVPAQEGDLRALCSLVNLRDDRDRILYLSSLVAALVPDIPQPLLVLSGPQGAAKTTAARMRRELLDPSFMETVTVRREIGELIQALDHHYMPVLDNLTRLSSWQEEVLCQAATGAGFTKRALYSDQDDVHFRFRRPVVLTGINLPSAAPDLLDRAVLIHLDRIPSRTRRDETRLWQTFRQERPRLLAGLLSTLAEAMRIEPQLELAGLSRMADFSRWGAAAAQALGFGADRFCEALMNNVMRQSEEVLEEDPVAQALRALLDRVGQMGQMGSFTGTATALLQELEQAGGPAGRTGLPRRAAELGRRLAALRAPLSEVGIQVRSERAPDVGRQRIWVIEGAGLVDGPH